MKGAKGISWLFITVFFSLLFLAVVWVMIMYAGWPLVKYGSINICWGKFISQIGELKAGTMYMGEYNTVDVDFGTCVLRLWFVNREQLEGDAEDKGIEGLAVEIEKEIKREYGREVSIKEKIIGQCDKENEENNGFIIASPWFGEEPGVGGMFTWVVIGAVAGGLIGPSGGPILGKITIKGVPLIPALKATIGALTAEKIREHIQKVAAALEEWGKTALCLPLKREFKYPKTIPDDEEIDIEKPPEGRYCIMLYKGREKYYVHAFEKDKKCKDLTKEEINMKIEEFKGEDSEQAG